MRSNETLIRDIKRCTVCIDSLPFGANPTIQMSETSRILIAGQAPGKRVHESGIPFDDPSGDRLREWLGVSKEIFYDPDCFAIVPMGFCYPGTGKTGDLPPKPACAATWRESVLASLSNVELTLVIGQYAMAYHLPQPRKNLTEVVSQWEDYWPEVLPLPHPSPRNNRWLKRNPWFQETVIPRLRQRVTDVLAHN
ncbi:uracil-DNA glycosylase family protein [Vibrio methylphosphonaticus]|uniref:uracil-DNA glycosylase family protein n=1 Tax=Vibrio methylphosphonaticus TaxID=2946866 RepID=UPI00202A100C|nr:uracil-DNA glycosylase family protein [Vibrio methylphosphonaticus]MCL9777168.1 uracil-DNA glycosylase family protein [Vibrio methylphosphonaticus]